MDLLRYLHWLKPAGGKKKEKKKKPPPCCGSSAGVSDGLFSYAEHRAGLLLSLILTALQETAVTILAQWTRFVFMEWCKKKKKKGARVWVECKSEQGARMFCQVKLQTNKVVDLTMRRRLWLNKCMSMPDQHAHPGNGRNDTKKKQPRRDETSLPVC